MARGTFEVLLFPIKALVRFRDYDGHGDWARHTGQVARVIRHNGPTYDYQYAVEWGDGDTSHVPHYNLVPSEVSNE